MLKSLTGQMLTVLPTARQRCDISSKGAVLSGPNDAEMGAPKLATRFNEIQQVK